MTIDALGNDPYLWLEDVDSEQALDWVRQRNAHAEAKLAHTERFATIKSGIREVLDSDAKIPGASKIGDYLYNFWRDDQHARGYWRRTTWDSYLTSIPEWETVLDIDTLNAAENEDWVWHGASALHGYTDTVLIELSHGGSDADVTREFNLHTKQFVAHEVGGFYRPASKGGMSWIDQNAVYIYSDFGPGSLTASGYPRIVKRLERGQAWHEAVTVFEGAPDDLYISAHRSHEPGYERNVIHRAMTFYTSETLLDHSGTLVPLELPTTAQVGIRQDWLLVTLRDPWQPVSDGIRYLTGTMLAINLEEYLAGGRDFTVLFTPTPHRSLAGASWTKHYLVLTVLDNVTTDLVVLTPPTGNGERRDPQGWSPRPLEGAPSLGTSNVVAIDPYESDHVWLYSTGFLKPTTMSLLTLGDRNPPQPIKNPPQPIKSAPAFFDATGMSVTQRFVRSPDGTRVPYFLIARSDLPLDGTTPTLLYGYGGFEISLTPTYSGALGRSWLERGGAYALANIRGGGEYGPAWHQAALTRNRHRAFEDFAAVARDLTATGIADAAHLGAQGGSNGGLLTGNMLTQYPELFGALVIQVPLLDMRRYTQLLAGASWAAEYGDPNDPEQWEFIKEFSPYHRFRAGHTYPPVLLTSSTRDDRVHPGHARKMAALLESAGSDVTYYENIEGGHGGAADNAQASHLAALAYEFLWQQLG